MESVYLDHAAATPLRPEVRQAMAPFMDGVVGNPSSVHRWGRAARAALDDARGEVAQLLGTSADEVIFVRGGTESVNLAIQGRAARLSHHAAPRPRFLRSALEHSSVRESFDSLGRRGFDVESIPVTPCGMARLPTPQDFELHSVGLVSMQWVNPEVGMILPVEEVAELCASTGTCMHVDAVQAVGRIPVRLDALPISMLSLSGHKLGGPRGAGVLIVRDGVELEPLMFGGGQERGIQPGTEDVAGAVGLARALRLSIESLESERARLTDLRDELERRLVTALPELRVHSGEAPRAPHILGIGIPGLPRDLLPGALDLEGIGTSAGSACRSGSSGVSHVLEALFGDDAGRVAPLRLSLGWSTTAQDVDVAARKIPEVVERMFTLGLRD